jgi:hypothetical protein
MTTKVNGDVAVSEVVVAQYVAAILELAAGNLGPDAPRVRATLRRLTQRMTARERERVRRWLRDYALFEPAERNNVAAALLWVGLWADQ